MYKQSISTISTTLLHFKFFLEKLIMVFDVYKWFRNKTYPKFPDLFTSICLIQKEATLNILVGLYLHHKLYHFYSTTCSAWFSLQSIFCLIDLSFCYKFFNSKQFIFVNLLVSVSLSFHFYVSGLSPPCQVPLQFSLVHFTCRHLYVQLSNFIQVYALRVCVCVCEGVRERVRENKTKKEKKEINGLCIACHYKQGKEGVCDCFQSSLSFCFCFCC
jgi:hypothetical protein